MTAELGIFLFGALALILFFVSVYVNERWHPDESQMGSAGQKLYRYWHRGLTFAELLLALSTTVAIVGVLAIEANERWLPHDVNKETVALQDAASDAVFIALDEKCASEYDDASRAEGLDAKERLDRLRRSCGVTIENGESAMLLRKDRLLYRVQVLSGDHSGYVGWTQGRTIRRLGIKKE